MADHLLKYQTLLHYWFLLVTIRLLPPEKKSFLLRWHELLLNRVRLKQQQQKVEMKSKKIKQFKIQFRASQSVIFIMYSDCVCFFFF